MTLRKYMAEAPCKVMDKLAASFYREYNNLLDGKLPAWDTDEKSALQLIKWALTFKPKKDNRWGSGPMINETDARDLEILCTNAAALLKRGVKK